MSHSQIELFPEQYDLPLAGDSPVAQVDSSKQGDIPSLLARRTVDPRHFFTVLELADRWGKTADAVRYHIRTGALQADKHKGRWLIPGIDVELFELRQERKKAPRVNERPKASRVVYDIVNQTLKEVNSSWEECND